MFYNKKIIVFDNAEGYTDDNGIYHNGEESQREIDCDVQPYSSDLLYKDYGYQEQVTKRVFCDNTPIVDVGKKVKYLDDLYVIKKTVPWDDYMEVMIDNL